MLKGTKKRQLMVGWLSRYLDSSIVVYLGGLLLTFESNEVGSFQNLNNYVGRLDTTGYITMKTGRCMTTGSNHYTRQQ